MLLGLMAKNTTLLTFVAGATGFTGRAMAQQDVDTYGIDLRLQVRPNSRSAALLKDDPRTVQVDLSDAKALREAMEGCHAVIQLIGTVRARFDAHTSYESVDYQTTMDLLEAAKATGVKHFVLLSSVGADSGLGSYLAWKKKTEEAVRHFGIPYTIFQPGYLAGDSQNPDRLALKRTSAIFERLTDAPLGFPLADWRPINIQVLASLMLHAVQRGPSDQTLSGKELFPLARQLGLLARNT